MAWDYDGAPPVGASLGTVTAVEGVTFCISDRDGDVRSGTQQGLFFRDTRFASTWALSIDRLTLHHLAVRRPAPYAATFIGLRPPRAGVADSTLLVVRHRYVGNGMLERIVVRNLGKETAAVGLALSVEADFAGLFEVKEGRVTERGGVECTVQDRTMVLDYERPGESRGTRVTGEGDVVVVPGQLSWQLVVPPREEASVAVQLAPVVDGEPVPPRLHLDEPVEDSQPAVDLAEWRRDAPRVHTPVEIVESVLVTSAEDLGSLRIKDPEDPGRTVVAAGAPWFMTLFGRDSLLTSWMTLPIDPSLALGTLRMLADLQGTEEEPLSEEQPGRILHEVRSGFDAEQALGGGNVYYGTADATPLFVMLLGELYRWGGRLEDVEPLLPNADRALAWVEQYGDDDGDGFVEYRRATDRGLANQGWKDSFDAINHASGALASSPVALAEVQAYLYAAYLSRAELAEAVGDTDLAADLRDRAARLRRRFNEVFWLSDRGYFAIALDGDKRPVDSLASNMGHCLWAGIVDDDKARAVARRLLDATMFTGFGLRTLATTMGAYNPVSYHNGSVWPHDTAIAAAGLMRYGFVAEAQRLALGLLAAADRFAARLPELFCGFARDEFLDPVPYPTSCSPQSWAAASPLLLLRSLLRLDPDLPHDRVHFNPAVPEAWTPLTITGMPLGQASITVTVTAEGGRIDGLPPGVEITP